MPATTRARAGNSDTTIDAMDCGTPPSSPTTTVLIPTTTKIHTTATTSLHPVPDIPVLDFEKLTNQLPPLASFDHLHVTLN